MTVAVVECQRRPENVKGRRMLARIKKRPEILLVVGGAAIAIGLASAYLLPDMWRRAGELAKEPQRITLRDLATNGLGDNSHVIVTDFTCGSGYVFEILRREGDPAPTADDVGWSRAWIPLEPKPVSEKKSRELPGPPLAVLLETPKTTTSGKGLHILSRKPSIEGLVMPLSRRGLSSDVRAKLAASNPNIDFGNCLVLEEYEKYQMEDTPVFANILAVGVGIGVLFGLPVFSVGLILFRNKRKQIGRRR